MKVGDGCVDWQRALGALRHVGFTGPLTVHTEYSFDESIIRRVGYAEISPPDLDQFAKEDVAYLHRILFSLHHPKGP